MAKNNRCSFFTKRIPLYRVNPVLFFHEVLKFIPDPWQEQAARDLAENPRVSIRSGQGVGKTGFEAACLLWFLCCFPYPRIVATAPTRQQLNDVLWSEVAKWQERSPLLVKILKWTKTYIYMVGYEKRWFAVARTATKAENMQGFHEDNMLFIVDEASGVADPIMEAIQGTLSGANNKLLMCGNPTRTFGVFYDSHTKDREMYKIHRVNSLESPRTNKENITSLMQKYGKKSNVVRVRVYGEFPLQEDDVFIPLSIIESATMKEPLSCQKFITLGVDVARFGNDETAIAENIGGDISIPIVRRGQNLMKTTGDIIFRANQLFAQYPQYRGWIDVNIDDTGLGGGVTDRLKEIIQQSKSLKIRVNPINFSSKVPDKKAAEFFDDITTFAWATVRDLLKNKEICLPNDNELIAQLSVRKYHMTSSGKIKLESKDEMKSRGIPSPDRADAVALTCFRASNAFDISGLIT